MPWTCFLLSLCFILADTMNDLIKSYCPIHLSRSVLSLKLKVEIEFMILNSFQTLIISDDYIL